jgi:hypothetical protein
LSIHFAQSGLHVHHEALPAAAPESDQFHRFRHQAVGMHVYGSDAPALHDDLPALSAGVRVRITVDLATRKGYLIGARVCFQALGAANSKLYRLVRLRRRAAPNPR